MDGGEFLQTSHPPEAKHCSLPSSEWQVRILGSVVQPASRFLPICSTDFPTRGTVRSEPICHNHFGTAMLAH